MKKLEKVNYLDLRPKEKEGKKEKKNLFQRLFNFKKLKKPNKVAVIFLKKNGTAEFKEETVTQGFFNIEGKTYHENEDCIYTIDKERLPLAIIPEWNLTPIGKQKWYDQEQQEIFAILQDHAMKGIRHAERVRMGEADGKKLNPKAAIGIAIAIVIVVAVFMGYK